MAALDPLCILNSDTQVGPDGVARRANEKVTRNYMQFGKYCFVSKQLISFEIRRIRSNKFSLRSPTPNFNNNNTSFSLDIFDFRKNIVSRIINLLFVHSSLLSFRSFVVPFWLSFLF